MNEDEDAKDEENKEAQALQQGHTATEIRCPCDIRNMEETGL